MELLVFILNRSEDADLKNTREELLDHLISTKSNVTSDVLSSLIKAIDNRLEKGEIEE